MFFQLLVVLAVLSVAVANFAPVDTKVTAKIGETNVDGLSGFNFKIVAPFKFQDYVVGFKYAIGEFPKAPESLFAKKSFETIADSTVDVEAEYTVADNALGVLAKWTSKQLGLSVAADASTKDRMRSVAVQKSLPLMDSAKVTVNAGYDFLKQKIHGTADVEADAATLSLSYDTESQDPVLSVTRDLDASNSISPSIKLRSGEINYGYKRTWNGGSLTSKLFPGDKVILEWKDKGAGGNWVTSADVPLADTKNTKVAFSREWNY